MTGNNPVDRSKLGTKRHILTDKEGILLSAAVISSASTHDIKLVTDVIDSAVIKRQSSSSSSVPTLGIRRRRKLQHLCLDKAYNSEPEEQKLIKRGYILHIPYKRNRGEKEKDVKGETQPSLSHKNILEKDGLLKEQTLGTTGSGNYSPDTKRR
jgi:putative transposase